MSKETDKELLVLAASAAGIAGVYHEHGEGMRIQTNPGHDWWNPLTDDDGDALRLAVKLEIMVDNSDGVSRAIFNGVSVSCEGADRRAATRRVIVRAAAEIGRKL